MKYENVFKLRLEHISGEIKETVESAYSKGYTDGRAEEKRKNANKPANDQVDATLMALGSIQLWLENIIPEFKIVRCKDCKQCKPLPPAYRRVLGENFIGKKRCDKFGLVVSGDDYCSFAERKEDETR